ncbi:MAG: radical SAM family heme chaperone HemW [Firmicutes bacterium]|nr:radical SAM family heme chaperone HemW [Bacillota bacterium]
MIKSCYIHIPFCDDICSYCDFCKIYTNRKLVQQYLNCLEEEIKTNYQGEVLDTIYIGGGTPSVLTEEELEKLFSILSKLNRSNHLEYTMECNIESITLEKLQRMKQYGVNRISLGIQTIDEETIQKLNRHHNKEMVMSQINLIKNCGFQNINVDLMYAFPWESKEVFLKDLDFFLSLDVPHISTYSLIIEDHTVFGIRNLKPISEDIDFWMYQELCKKMKELGYDHYEVSNFAKPNYESKHNLTYWNNLEYYGFGLGASGYVNQIRYENTKSFTKYLKKEYRLEEHLITKEEDMENECILSLRKLDGISKDKFRDKFGVELEQEFPVTSLLEKGLLCEKENQVFIPEKNIYLSNDILIEFLHDN